MTRQSQLPDIAMRFFDNFARFENALKHAGYLQKADEAKADWDRFARSLNPSFFDTVRNAPEAATLVTAPPKKRVNKNGSLEWREGQKVTDATSLFLAIRRARNNLFHGDKFIGEAGPDERSRQLLEDALWILDLALSMSDELKKTFVS